MRRRFVLLVAGGLVMVGGSAARACGSLIAANCARGPTERTSLGLSTTTRSPVADADACAGARPAPRWWRPGRARS